VKFSIWKLLFPITWLHWFPRVLLPHVTTKFFSVLLPHLPLLLCSSFSLVSTFFGPSSSSAPPAMRLMAEHSPIRSSQYPGFSTPSALFYFPPIFPFYSGDVPLQPESSAADLNRFLSPSSLPLPEIFLEVPLLLECAYVKPPFIAAFAGVFFFFSFISSTPLRHILLKAIFSLRDLLSNFLIQVLKLL